MVIERERCEETREVLSCGVVFVTEFYKLREARSQAAIHERRRVQLIRRRVGRQRRHCGKLLLLSACGAQAAIRAAAGRGRGVAAVRCRWRCTMAALRRRGRGLVLFNDLRRAREN